MCLIFSYFGTYQKVSESEWRDNKIFFLGSRKILCHFINYCVYYWNMNEKTLSNECMRSSWKKSVGNLNRYVILFLSNNRNWTAAKNGVILWAASGTILRYTRNFGLFKVARRSGNKSKTCVFKLSYRVRSTVSRVLINQVLLLISQ